MDATSAWSSHGARRKSTKSSTPGSLPARGDAPGAWAEPSWAMGGRAFRRVADARFRSAFDNAAIGMALVGKDGRWIDVNDAPSRITGYSRDELKATTLRAVTHPDDLALDTLLERDLVSGAIPSYHVEKRYRHARGHYLWVLVSVSLARDNRSRPLYMISQVQDISERKARSRRLEHLVDHDFLTGLFNRRRFEQELAKEALRIGRYGFPGAVVLIDLDHFKDVNDALGHKAGDELLEGVAGELRHQIRETDVLARVGGDEFAVLLPHTAAEEAQIVAEGIVETVRQHVVFVDEQPISVTASVGVALFDDLDACAVMASADRAMYEAKATGRDRFVVNRPVSESQERASGRLAKAERVRKNLEEERVLLYCQPILDLKANEILQYELLLKFPRIRGGKALSPADFAYRAERSGLVQAVDSWALCKAIAHIAQHERGGRRLSLHVKLSGASIDSKIAALTESALTEAGIDPTSLVLEVTDTARIANIHDAKKFTERIRARGCRFVLGDFPSLGSFYYIKNLPFDYLKIDRDFIRGIAGNPVDHSVVQAIVDIARELGKETIAEWVGDDATAQLLRQSGVDYAVGVHVGEARPLTDALPRG